VREGIMAEREEERRRGGCGREEDRSGQLDQKTMEMYRRAKVATRNK